MFIKSNRTHDTLIRVTIDSKEREFLFPCVRHYSDTGNIANTGIVTIKDEDYNWLFKNCRQFKALMNNGEFKVSKTDGAKEVASEITNLQKENSKLKEQLEAKIKEAATATSEETESLKSENEELKKKIEELVKGSKGGKAKKDEKPLEDPLGEKGKF